MAANAARMTTLFMTKTPKTRVRTPSPLRADAALPHSIPSARHHRTLRRAGQGVAVALSDAVNAEIGEEFIKMTKAEGSKPAQTELKADTKVTTGGRNPHAHDGDVNTPVYHASTLLYRGAEDYLGNKSQYHHSRRRTQTPEGLEQAIHEIERTARPAV